MATGWRPRDCKTKRLSNCRRHQFTQPLNPCKECGWCSARCLEAKKNGGGSVTVAADEPMPRETAGENEPDEAHWDGSCACGVRISGDCYGKVVYNNTNDDDEIIGCRFNRWRSKKS